MRTALSLAPVILVSAVVLAGCGGGSGGSTTPGATSTAGSSGGAQSGAYQGGFEICSGGTVEEIASLYGVPAETAEAVSGGTPEDATDATEGCLDAFAQQP